MNLNLFVEDVTQPIKSQRVEFSL